MSQFGMQMPGGRTKRAASMDVYTGLLLVAVLSLLAACIVLWMAGSEVGKGGSPIALQEPGKIELAARDQG